MLRKLLEKNRSYRRFRQNERIGADIIAEWIDMTRFCASGRNIQPLKYAVITDSCICAEVFGTLKWAGFLADWDGPEEGERPSAYIVQLLDKSLAADPMCDDGLHLQTLTLAAVEAGFGGCIIKSFNVSDLRKILELPDHLEIRYVLALGRPAETVRIETMENGDYRYWRTPDMVHHVPKRRLNELLFKIYGS